MRIYNQSKAPINFIQIFGERNSGTTYLSKLIQDNMKVPNNLLGMAASAETPLGNRIFGYKHWFLNWERLQDPRQSQTLFIVIYRNPYTWIRAMMDRPYALSKSISGKTVEELPNIKLAGHINGKDTKNEFDPKTGKTLSIFQLRGKKIESFEGLKSKVENVVFLNLEEFLDDPSSVIARLAQEFSSAFSSELTFERQPYRQLIGENRSPNRFIEQEEAVLNAAINWKAENKIGYQKGNYSLSIGSKLNLIILHGGSGVGKSYIMDKLLVEGANLTSLEMDDCRYWEADKPLIRASALNKLVPAATDHEIDAFVKLTSKEPIKSNKCIAYLLVKLNELFDSVVDVPLSNMIATCGALPNPGAPGAASVYKWLSDRLSISFTHILIDITLETHLRQIEKRGRLHLKASILKNQEKKKRNPEYYDCVTSSFEGVSEFIRTESGRAIPPNIGSGYVPRIPNVRVSKNNDLTHIQIFGERNSGTKFLKQQISENARYPGNILGAYATRSDPINKAKLIGYKHYYPRPEKIAKHQSNTLFLVIYKNPYTWIRSMMSKPYHFRDCLNNKTILDLPDLKLAGLDVHGREIPDVHPITGERISMFELRKFKIQKWEQLKDQVNNVVYINYEDLLLSPTQVTQRVFDEFSSLFNGKTAPDYVPDEKYVTKYVNPKPFKEIEMNVMNSNIDWAAEALAGYEKDNLFVPD